VSEPIRIERVEAIPVSVPYRHREVSAVVARDGVSDVLVRVEAQAGRVAWGEACCGADTASVAAAVEAMAPLVVGRDAWNREAMRRDLFGHALWQFRYGTGSFAWGGIEMALWDLCGRAAGEPVWRLLGGLLQPRPTYFAYLQRGDQESLAAQCADGLAAGYDVFYLKVGLDDTEDRRMVAQVREALGPGPRLRLDANAAWTPAQALRNLEAMAEHDLDFVEQPVRESPIDLLRELRRRSPVALCANEGLWSEADCYARMRAQQADVFCLSAYWVGGLAAFHRLAWVAHAEGLAVCKHTHGELGLAAAAGHHVCLAIPNGVDGHQQTASIMAHDVLREQLPIATGPAWGPIEAPGLGVEVDEDAVAEAAARYRSEGMYRPWQPEQVALEER
jgi:L-alanine-DL-glutamate epimerase-like enolase superfamily enzyme